MIEFKKIDFNGWAQIQKIAYGTWSHTFGQMIAPEQINYMLERIYNEDSLRKQMLEKGHIFVLAEKEYQPAGFASYELNYHSLPQMMIHKLYLLPDSQGSGIGTQFLDLLSQTAKQNNNTSLRLKVFYRNDKAIRFYEKKGFVKTGTETTDIGNNYNILDNIMIKTLL